MGRVFVNGPGDMGSIPRHVILKTLKMVLDTSLLKIQQYKVRIKGKVEITMKMKTIVRKPLMIRIKLRFRNLDIYLSIYLCSE